MVYICPTQNYGHTFGAFASELEKEMPSPEDGCELCQNTDCERFPEGWDPDEDTLDNWPDGRQWVKCNLCDGFFSDDGFNDILFIEEAPNNRTDHCCSLCGKTRNIVQMKGSGQYICGNACDESDDESGNECE